MWRIGIKFNIHGFFKKIFSVISCTLLETLLRLWNRQSRVQMWRCPSSTMSWKRQRCNPIKDFLCMKTTFMHRQFQMQNLVKTSSRQLLDGGKIIVAVVICGTGDTKPALSPRVTTASMIIGYSLFLSESQCDLSIHTEFCFSKGKKKSSFHFISPFKR